MSATGENRINARRNLEEKNDADNFREKLQ